MGRPAGVAFQHFLGGRRFLAGCWVSGCEWAQHVVNCMECCAENSPLSRLSLGHKKEVVDVYVDGGQGREMRIAPLVRSGRGACGFVLGWWIAGRCRCYVFQPVNVVCTHSIACTQLHICQIARSSVSVIIVKNGGDSTHPIGKASQWKCHQLWLPGWCGQCHSKFWDIGKMKPHAIETISDIYFR